MRIRQAYIHDREYTITQAVNIVARGLPHPEQPNALVDMLTRLLEELTQPASGEPLLTGQQLSRILQYRFEIVED
jgi:hypothetical protein